MSAMQPRYRISRQAIDLIKRFEGYRARSARLLHGGWTIGYGHTLTAREGAEVSEPDAEALLIYDLIAVANALNEQVFAPLTQNQFDALAAFAFNIGLENFQRSAVLRRLNEGQLVQAACAMELWRKAELNGERIVVDALVRRRSAEKTLFLTPPGGFLPVPTPVVPPQLDTDLGGTVPEQSPTAVNVAMNGETAVAERVDALVGENPTPPQAAAEAVASRLAAIFPDEAAPTALPLEPEPEVAPEPEVELDSAPEPEQTLEAGSASELEPETIAEGIKDAEAPIDAFELTSPEEDFSADALDGSEPPPPSFDAEPNLFDLQPPTANEEPVTAPAPEEAPRLFESDLQDAQPDIIDAEFTPSTQADAEAVETDSIVLPVIRDPQPTPLAPFLAPLGLAAGGVVIFGAGVYGGVNNYNGLAWLAGVVGIVMFAIAVYLLLDRLGDVDPDFEIEDDDSRDQT